MLFQLRRCDTQLQQEIQGALSGISLNDHYAVSMHVGNTKAAEIFRGKEVLGDNISGKTRFPIFYMTQLFTIVLARASLEEGSLALNEFVDSYVPGFEDSYVLHMKVCASKNDLRIPQYWDTSENGEGEFQHFILRNIRYMAKLIVVGTSEEILCYELKPMGTLMKVHHLVAMTSGVGDGWKGVHMNLNVLYETADVPRLTPLKITDQEAGYFSISAAHGVNTAFSNTFPVSHTLKDYVKQIAKLPLLNDPGSSFQLGASFVVLSRVLEKALSSTFDDLISDLTSRLKLANTGFPVFGEFARHTTPCIYLDTRCASVGEIFKNGFSAIIEQARIRDSESAVSGLPSFHINNGDTGMFSTLDDVTSLVQSVQGGTTLATAKPTCNAVTYVGAPIVWTDCGLWMDRSMRVKLTLSMTGSFAMWTDQVQIVLMANAHDTTPLSSAYLSMLDQMIQIVIRESDARRV